MLISIGLTGLTYHRLAGVRHVRFFLEIWVLDCAWVDLKVDLNLGKPLVKKLVKQNSFKICVIKQWNSLPKHVVMVPALNAFKNKLDDYWINHYYLARVGRTGIWLTEL